MVETGCLEEGCNGHGERDQHKGVTDGVHLSGHNSKVFRVISQSDCVSTLCVVSFKILVAVKISTTKRNSSLSPNNRCVLLETLLLCSFSGP